jgi:hypothetical protein
MSDNEVRLTMSELRARWGEACAYIDGGGKIVVFNGQDGQDRFEMTRRETRDEADAIAALYLQHESKDEPPIGLSRGQTVEGEVDRLVAEHASLDSLRQRRRKL